jgi:nucleoside-diphosphate-sugar epimerase
MQAVATVGRKSRMAQHPQGCPKGTAQALPFLYPLPAAKMRHMKVLFIGGTGEISYACLEAAAGAGHQCTVFNRGRSEEPLPDLVRQITGDLNDREAFAQLAREKFDVICQFLAYRMADIERDVETFAGRVGQYIFISTASAYQKPPPSHIISEQTPLANPYWPYSRAKAEMEARLIEHHEAKKLPVTIVRPSHTFRRRFPGTMVSGDINAWRIEQGRPIIIHGDGTSLWTLTHSTDFAVPFVKLLGAPRALGEAFHIASDCVYTWNEIFSTVGKALGAEPRIVHVPTDTLLRYRPEWEGPLLGDKAWSTTFDHSKLKAIAGPLPRPGPLAERFAKVVPYYRERSKVLTIDRDLHDLLDRIIADQEKLGR